MQLPPLQLCSTPPNKEFPNPKIATSKIQYQLYSISPFFDFFLIYTHSLNLQHVVPTTVSSQEARAGRRGGSHRGSEAALPGNDRETRTAVGLYQKGLLDRELADAAYHCCRGCRCILSSHCIFFRLRWSRAGALYPYFPNTLHWFVVSFSLLLFFVMRLFCGYFNEQNR